MSLLIVQQHYKEYAKRIWEKAHFSQFLRKIGFVTEKSREIFNGNSTIISLGITHSCTLHTEGFEHKHHKQNDNKNKLKMFMDKK